MIDGPFPSPLRGVLFDVDGTLADSTGTCVAGLADTYEHFTGVRPSDADVLALMGIPLLQQMNLFGLDQLTTSTAEERVDYCLQRYEVHEAKTSLFEEAVAAMDDCIAVGLKVALVTSKNATELRIFFDAFPRFHSVHTAVCASDIERPKPEPDCALLACDRLGVEPKETIFVGDSVYDQQCAFQAGIPFVAVGYGAAPLSRLQAGPHLAAVQTPEQLRALLKTNLDQSLCDVK